MSDPAQNNLPLIDVHVHLLGNGLGGSGCWFRTPWWQTPFLQMMARNVGMGISCRHPEFDLAYVAQLRQWLARSSLGAVVLLACDEVYTVSGEKRTDLMSTC
jgi:hypothetical protein